LARAATAWGSIFEPVVAKPNNKNAERLYFIRELTRGFRLEFSAPLRASVFTIAAQFFDMTGISQNDITKLAP
jgi:hypothetical protein